MKKLKFKTYPENKKTLAEAGGGAGPEREVLPKGQGTSRTLKRHLLSYRYCVSKHFTKVTLGEIEGSL